MWAISRPSSTSGKFEPGPKKFTRAYAPDAVRDPGRGVGQNATAADVGDPVGGDAGSGVGFEAIAKVFGEAGDGDLDEEADVARPWVAVLVEIGQRVRTANDHQVGQRTVAGVEGEHTFGPEAPVGGKSGAQERR